MTVDSQTARIAFLDEFFGPANALNIDPHAIDSADPSHAFLNDLVRDIRDGAPWPWLLPRRAGQQQHPTWYAITFDYADFRRLGAELGAVAGDPYSDFTPTAAALNTSDGVETAIARLGSGTHVYRFAPSPGHVATLRSGLERLHSAWTQRPQRSWVRVRPLGRVLRDFELALAGRHHQRASEALAEIERNRQLTATNLLFLRFRLVATFESPQNAINFPGLETLVAIRRPRTVTVAAQRLIFDAYLLGDNQALPVNEAIERFKIDVAQRYGPLFKVLSPTDDPSAARLQMLAASTGETPNDGYAEDVLSRPWSPEVSAWLHAVWARRRQEPAPQRTATQAYQLGDLDAAFTAAIADRPGPGRAKILVLAAVSIGTRDAAIAAVEAFDALSDDEQGVALSDALLRLALQELRGRTRFLPATWTDWFERLEENPKREAIDLLDEALPGWQATALDSDQAVAALSDLFLTTRGPEQMNLVADAVPRALAYSQRSGASGSRLAPLHNALLAVLTYESDLTATDLGAISDLASTVLNTGMEIAQYQQLLLDLLDVWARVKSWRRCDWAADILDAVVASPAPAPPSRDAFVIELYSQLTAYANRVTAAQKVLLRLLGREAGQPIEVWEAHAEESVEDEGAQPPNLDGLSIGIYTLDEGAAATARSWILEIAPSAKVVLNHEHDASERLTAMVRGSDIVVVGWATAKHSATNHIRDTKRDGTLIAMAEGRGATGLFRAVMSAAI